MGVATLISGKNILQAKKVTRDKDGHNIMIKGTPSRRHTSYSYAY